MSAPRVLMIGPNPPPLGGIVSMIDAIVSSPLRERFAFERFGTTTRILPAPAGLRRLANSALARAFGMSGIVQLETFAKLRALRTRLDAGGVDLAHVHASHGYDALLAGLFARETVKRGIPTLLHTHGNYDVVVPKLSPIERRAFRAAVRTPDRVVVLSEGWRTWFSDWAQPDRIDVLHNCVDAERFRPADGTGAGRPPTVLFVGAMDPERKGAYDVVACAAELARAAPGVRILVVGDDVGRIEERLVRGTPLADVFRFLGRRGPGEIEPLFRDADLLLLPSYAEGLPIVLLEAMASGLPVVASPVNGIPEALRVPEGGVFVQPGDRAAIVAAVSGLLADPQRRAAMGRANRARILAEFDARVYAKRLGAIYDRLVRERRSAAG